MSEFDVAVVGGGIAGVSIAAELCDSARVVLLEAETALGVHATGRSAATYLQSYGPPPVRALSTASHDYLSTQVSQAVLRPLPMLHVAAPGREALATELHDSVKELVPSVRLLTGTDAADLVPVLRADRVGAALLEPAAMELDVHTLHDDYRRRARAGGATIVAGARVGTVVRSTGGWRLQDSTGRTWTADILVNAAGAWADQLAALSGAVPLGLRPLRRTAFIVDLPRAGTCPAMVADLDNAFYVKPDGGALLCSPADETPAEPGVPRPDELEIARAMEAINEWTTLDIRHVRRTWAGLRTFTADRVPAVGWDDGEPGLFWFAGQGGYGIQTAPALARLGAALVRGDEIPADIAACGVRREDLAPARFGTPGA